MGTVEQKARKVRRLRTFQKAALIAVLAGAMVLTGAVPDFNKILRYFIGNKKGARFNYRIKTALGRLAANGLVTFEEREGKRYARITEVGKQVLEFESLRDKALRKPRRWDGRCLPTAAGAPRRPAARSAPFYGRAPRSI